MDLGGLVLGSLILYLKGMRIMMFQLSGFYYKFTDSNRPAPDLEAHWAEILSEAGQGCRCAKG